ncbi:MAG TPA: hypothetical protein VJH37_02625 [Candidatus Nanoarchaeia archaeon]|nr:hypothetical protein [Candidatus Nanoarchaeia archaeon]
MKALFPSLFCAFFLLSFVAEANLQITDSQLRYGGSSTHKREFFSSTLAFSNAFTDCNLQNINLQFVERNDFRRSNININETSELNFGQTGTTLVTITTTDFDVVDEELEERGEVEIGTLSLTADKINATTPNPFNCEGSVTSNSIPVKLQLKNDLNLLSVEIKGPDGDFETVSEDSTETIIVDEDYDLRFKIRNAFESSSDIQLVNINIQIESNDLDIDKSTTISEIAAGEEGEKTTSVSVDDTGSDEVTVFISGDDRFGGKHGRIFTFNFDVEEAEEEEPADENDGDGDGVPDNSDECLDTISICDVDGAGCPIDSDEDGTCDALDLTPRPTQQETDEDEIDTTSANEDEELKEDITQKEQPTDDQDSTKGFIPFLIGFAVGIMVTAGFSVLIKS